MVTATRPKNTYGIKTEAYAADPSRSEIYELRYKVMELNDIVASHDDKLQPNPEYPQELQPRLRDRAASKVQVDNIARNLNAKALLHDTGFIDTGPMIVGSDNVVESGNGRVLGLRLAAKEYPQRYRLYRTVLINQADKYGLSEKDIEPMRQPVLVRERVSEVDRVEFARAANVGAVMGMSPYEQAVNDSKKLKAEIISQLQVGEDQSIDQALRLRANDYIVKHFVSTVPENERATIADEKGQINIQGMNRLKLALFTKTYTGEAGQRLARIFGESADPQIKSIENAMFQTLPDMAKAESLIDAGSREKDLSIAPDLAEVIDSYAGIKTAGITVKDYLAQQAMFEDRLNPLQKNLLDHFDDISRKPKLIREFLRETAQRVIEAPAKGQSSMLGIEPVTKEGLIYGVINRQRADIGKPPIASPIGAADGKQLEKPDSGRAATATGLQPGNRENPASGKEPDIARGTSVQIGMVGLGKETAQMKMLEEFGTAPGTGGKKETLIDIEAIKAKEAAKPLPGQIDFITGKTVEGKNIPAAEKLEAKAETTASTLKKEASRKRKITSDKRKKTDSSEKSETLAELRKIHKSRSLRSQTMDNSQLHSKVINSDDPKVEQWKIHPGDADIEGVDTPSKEKSITRVTIREIKPSEVGASGGRTANQTRRNQVNKKRQKQRDMAIDLGAGVVRTKRRQHIKLR